MDRPTKRTKLAANPATPPSSSPNPKITQQANVPLPNTANNPQGLVPLPVSQPAPVNRGLALRNNQQRAPVNRLLFANQQCVPVSRLLFANQQRLPPTGPLVANHRSILNPTVAYQPNPNPPTRYEERLQRCGLMQLPPGQQGEWSSPERIPATRKIRAPILGVPRPHTPPSPTPKSQSEGQASASRHRYPNETYFDKHGPNPTLMSDREWFQKRGYKNQVVFNKLSGFKYNVSGDYQRGIDAVKKMRDMEEDEWKEVNGRHAANAHWGIVMERK